jgi:hypothetical protein
MFKKVSNRGALLFVGVMAVCALAMPAMAGAASWTGTLGNHVFDGSNPANRLAFSVAAISSGSTCAVAQFPIDIRSASDAQATHATFINCMGVGNAVNCTATATGTNFPWTVTNPTTANVTIDGVDVDVNFENTPGNATACGVPGNVRVTGNLSGGAWTNPAHEITFTNATGTTAHTSLGSFPATVTGTLRDTAQTLTMAD